MHIATWFQSYRKNFNCRTKYSATVWNGLRSWQAKTRASSQRFKFPLRCRICRIETHEKMQDLSSLIEIILHTSFRLTQIALLLREKTIAVNKLTKNWGKDRGNISKPFYLQRVDFSELKYICCASLTKSSEKLYGASSELNGPNELASCILL